MPGSKVTSCAQCQRSVPYVSRALGVCAACVQSSYSIVRRRLEAVHAEERAEFDLPPAPPRSAAGVRCTLCGNECVIGEAERGFCGLRSVRGGRLVHLAGTPARGLLHWYRDPLPTNCVADWVCEGHRHPGCHNLAVFYCSCTADCLFCQNWHFRKVSISDSDTMSATELAAAANSRTYCVCYFGGDPASQMPHALATSKLLAGRGVRVCWETAGTMHPKLLDRAVGYSLDTGGCIKFDLKAFDESLHRTLAGISNRRTLENFARAAKRCAERCDPPLVVASTLLVPGYVDADQVGKIASFIASVDPQIPYSLLAFAPNFYMSDLPYTSAGQAREAETAARAAGLANVRIGNRHLLGLGPK
ncbi:MAG: radical SAM protein [Gemmatimonadota bacterium]|nr:MAG: radical SAM protein [Gemmatimonadota bacterium]